MFGMGAALAIRDFLVVGKQPSGLALGLFAQLVLVPLLAVAFISLFGLEPGWAVGLCLIAVVPGGAFSNLLTFFGRANVALSIAITVVSTSLCIITVPLLLGLLVSTSLPADFHFPVSRVVIEICAYLVGPLVLGMIACRWWPARSAMLSKRGIQLSVVLLILITLSALRSGRIKVAEYGIWPPLIIILFGLTLSWLAPALCWLTKRSSDDAVAITVEVTVRNMGVGLLLVEFFFPGKPQAGHVLYSCLFYAGASGLFALPPAIAHRIRPGRYPNIAAAVRFFLRERKQMLGSAD